MRRASILWRFVQPIIQVAWLPAVLAVLFAFQNVAYDAWLGISPEIYQRMMLAAFSCGFVLYGPALYLRGRWRRGFLLGMTALVGIFFLGQYLFYSYSSAFLQLKAVLLIGQANSFLGTAAGDLQFRQLFFFAGLLLVLWVFYGSRRRRRLLREGTAPRLSRWATAVLALGHLGLVFVGYAYLAYSEYRDYGRLERLTNRMYDLEAAVGKMGIGNYFLQDSFKQAFMRSGITPEDRAFVAAWSGARPAAPQATDYRGVAKGRNLIIIQVESLETAVMGSVVEGVEVVPRLNALAKEGLYYSRYYSAVGYGNTADAEFTVLNSLYTLPDAVPFVERAHNQYAALPKYFGDRGYLTAVMHGDYAAFWNRSSIYPNLGYQEWFMEDKYTITRPIGITGLGDADFFEQSLPKVEALKRPFLVTLMTLSSHTPFEIPEDLREPAFDRATWLVNPEERRYLESVHYADATIGKFIDGLKQTDLYANSVIVIVGDHGSYLNMARALRKDRDDTEATANARVPMILLVPGTDLAGERDIPASHLDLFPTLANLFGFDAPGSALGQDLLATRTPVAVLRNRGTDQVLAAVGPELTYSAAADGVFERGACLETVSRAVVPMERCRALYEEQTAMLKVSDTVVRGNLVGELVASPPATVAAPAALTEP